MKQFIWNLQCMIAAKKYAKEHEQCRTEYQWYGHLVVSDIKSFFNRLKFWNRQKKNSEIPF